MATRTSNIFLTPPDKEGMYLAKLTPSSHFGWAYLEVHHSYSNRDPFVGHGKVQSMLERKIKQLADDGWKQVSGIKLRGSYAGVWVERRKPAK